MPSWNYLGGDLGRLGGVLEAMMIQDSAKIAQEAKKVAKTMKNQWIFQFLADRGSTQVVVAAWS